MSNFNEQTVRKMADLARLMLTENEIELFNNQVSDILGYIEKLNSLDTGGVEPMMSALEMDTPLRPDEKKQSLGAEVILGCAPESLHGSFKVPQVMSGGL